MTTRITVTDETIVDTGSKFFVVEVEISFRPLIYAPKGNSTIPIIPKEGFKTDDKSTFVVYMSGSIFGPSHLVGLVGLGGVPLSTYGAAVVESGDLIVKELFTTP